MEMTCFMNVIGERLHGYGHPKAKAEGSVPERHEEEPVIERRAISDLRHGGKQRVQPETGWLGGEGSMAPLPTRREGIDGDEGE